MKGLIDLVVPTGMAVAVAVFKTEPAEQATSVTFPQARHVATFAADGWDCHLMALLQPWTADHREWAQRHVS